MLSMAIQVFGAGPLAKKFDRAASQTPSKLEKAVMRAGYLVQHAAKQNLTGGNPLNVRTGRLRSSVQVESRGSGKEAAAVVGTKVKYGAVHEFGSTFMSSWGRGNALRQITIPERPWLQPALRGNRDKIRKIIDKAVGDMLKGAGL